MRDCSLTTIDQENKGTIANLASSRPRATRAGRLVSPNSPCETGPFARPRPRHMDLINSGLIGHSAQPASQTGARLFADSGPVPSTPRYQSPPNGAPKTRAISRHYNADAISRSDQFPRCPSEHRACFELPSLRTWSPSQYRGPETWPCLPPAVYPGPPPVSEPCLIRSGRATF